MKIGKEHIKIERRIKQRDYKATINGIEGFGKSALDAYRNARLKLNLIKESEKTPIKKSSV